MRERLFRGKTEEGKWIEGYGCVVLEEDCVIIHKEGINLMQHTPVMPESFGEFTGVLDKNGKRIFDGDIVIVQGRKRVGKYTTFIKYNRNGFVLDRNETYFVDRVLVSKSIEVIGNIHDNKDLLAP